MNIEETLNLLFILRQILSIKLKASIDIKCEIPHELGMRERNILDKGVETSP